MPLPCFGERDLKFAHRENVSYQKFTSTEQWSREKETAVEPAFGQGKRGQPLKILIRNRDPKVDSILDLLVLFSCPFPAVGTNGSRNMGSLMP